MSHSSRPLRIGIITDGLEERLAGGEAVISNGGVGVYIYNLVKHLRVVDPSNEYYLIRRGPGRLDIYEDTDRNVLLQQSALTRVARAFDLPYTRIATELRLDLLHYPNQFGGAFLPRRIKRVVTLHDVTPLLFPQHHPWRSVLGYRLLMRRALRLADHVIVDSHSTRGDIVGPGLAESSKVTVVPLGVAGTFKPCSLTEELARRYDLPERFILNVGVLEPRKNHAVLVNALRRLHEGAERINLVIVGREGWRWKDPLEDASVQHLRPWVRILRNVPDSDLPELYTRAAVFAYPSLYEGFGLPVVEAMACGTPVITSARSALPEVAGNAALLVDPTDPRDIAAKLLAILRDPALRDRLAAEGKSNVAHLSWRRTAKETLAIYERVARPTTATSESATSARID